MLETPRKVQYPAPDEPFPEADWWEQHATSVDTAIGNINQTMEHLHTVTGNADRFVTVPTGTYRGIKILGTARHDGLTTDWRTLWMRLNGHAEVDYRNNNPYIDGAGLTPSADVNFWAALGFVGGGSARGAYDATIWYLRDDTGGAKFSWVSNWSSNVGTASGNYRSGTAGGVLMPSTDIGELFQIELNCTSDSLGSAGTRISVYGIR